MLKVSFMDDHDIYPQSVQNALLYIVFLWATKAYNIL